MQGKRVCEVNSRIIHTSICDMKLQYSSIGVSTKHGTLTVLSREGFDKLMLRKSPYLCDNK